MITENTEENGNEGFTPAERPFKRISVTEFKKASIDTCFRPDIYLNNDRKCNKCPNTEFCSCYLNKGIEAKTIIEEDIPEDIL